MNRILQSILGIVFILIITFCAISISQNIGKGMKLDITEQRIYTLSDGTKSILSKLNQPVKIKLYYAETAALKGPDQIRFFNNYYYFVKALLEEYVANSKGMVDLQVIDPRPFSEDEEQAMRFGLKRFPITEEENFFFGLVVQTQFGAEKTIPFFSPDRQNFVEYDISYLIDTAITRDKSRIGVISSLPITGQKVTDYMRRMMMMQGQQPQPAWGVIEQLRQQYEVNDIEADVDEIKDVDILLVVHPKDLSEKTLFAIDQFVLKGGKAIVCVDPHCIIDQPDQQQQQMGMQYNRSSNLEPLFAAWGLTMPDNTFAGDRELAIRTSLMRDQRPQKVIGFLGLNRDSFNSETVMTAELNDVRMLFPGVLKKKDDTSSVCTPLVMTTNRGNSWTVSSPYELMMPDPAAMMRKFIDGTEPVYMGYLVTGKFQSAFPEGIEVELPAEDNSESEETDEQEPKTKILTGLTEAQDECAVIVFSDVDFISDMLAYQTSIFGRMAIGDNSSLLVNAVDELGGSSDLMTIRSRGNYRRPFDVVDEIEQQAEAETANEEQKINAEIAGFEQELNQILSQAKEGDEEVVGSSILQKKKELELKIRQAQRDLREVKMTRRERIESLGNKLRNINMLLAPAIILVIAIVLAIYRSTRRRFYISHNIQE